MNENDGLYVEYLQKIINSVPKLEEKFSELEDIEKRLRRGKYSKATTLKIMALDDSEISKKNILELFTIENQTELINKQKNAKCFETSYVLTDCFTTMLSMMRRIVNGESINPELLEILIGLFESFISLTEAAENLNYNFNPIIPLLTELNLALSEFGSEEDAEIKKCADSLYNLIFEEDESE